LRTRLYSNSTTGDTIPSPVKARSLEFRYHKPFFVTTNTSRRFGIPPSKSKAVTQIQSQQHLLCLSLHHYNCDQHQAQSFKTSQHRNISGKRNPFRRSLAPRAILTLQHRATMRPHVFAVLLCILTPVDSTFAGLLPSIMVRFATYLMVCASSIEACDNKCHDPGTCQMLTRDGWVFSPTKPDTTCVSKCERVAVAGCVDVPHAIVRLL
jgi:hypothetical protein